MVSYVWVKLIRLTNSHSMPKEYFWVMFIPYCVGWSGHFQRVAINGLGTRLSSTCEKVGIKWNTNALYIHESTSACSSYLSMLRNYNILLYARFSSFPQGSRSHLVWSVVSWTFGLNSVSIPQTFSVACRIAPSASWCSYKRWISRARAINEQVIRRTSPARD